MKTGKNKGISLVEILVVVSILSIMVGGSSIAISLAYSRDAEKCARLINASLETTRMLSMSEMGKFVMTVDYDQKKVTIVRDLEGTVEEMENEELPRRVTLYTPGTSLTSVSVQFDKSTGEVLSMDAESEGLLTITAENSGGRKASVVLVKGTGKHYVDYK